VKRQNQNRPSPFAGRMLKEVTKPGLGFRVYFVLLYIFWSGNVCFCCVRFSFSLPRHKIGLGNVSEMTCFVLSGT